MLPVFANDRFDYLVFQISSLIWLIPELIRSFSRSRNPNAQVHDRASRYVLLSCIFVGIFLGLNIAFAFSQYAIPWDRLVLFWMGIILMLSGVAFRWYAVRVLGKYFTPVVSIQAGQTVVEKGPYRFIRHPSYTGAFITFLGLGLVLSNWLSLGMIFLAVVIGYGYRVHVEEQALVEALGQPYRDYMKRTKRFIPFLF